jgi:hypothetical protein
MYIYKMVLNGITSWCKKNQLVCAALVLVVLWYFGFLDQILGLVGFGAGARTPEGFTGSPATTGSSSSPAAAEETGNEGQMAVQGYPRTPSTCYPQQTLKPEDLLPEDQAKAAGEFASSAITADGLMGVNMLKAGEHVGVNTVGQSLRNANRQLRSEPPNPQVNVSPWMNSNIGPDLMRRPLEAGSASASGADL